MSIKAKTKSNIAKRLLAVAVLTLTMTACNQLFGMKVVRYADKTSYMASTQTLETVDRAFYATFLMGDWDYQGSNAVFGEVRAYIKIPAQLDMSKDVQQQYLQQIICPGQDNLDLWYKLKNIDLEIHIFTDNRNNSVSATCINPLADNIA